MPIAPPESPLRATAFHVASGTVVVITNSDGDTVLAFNADTGRLLVEATTDFNGASILGLTNLTAAGNVGLGTDGASTLGFYGATKVARQTITGALSTVVDPSAKAVLTSIIAALVATGFVADGTT